MLDNEEWTIETWSQVLVISKLEDFAFIHLLLCSFSQL